MFNRAHMNILQHLLSYYHLHNIYAYSLCYQVRSCRTNLGNENLEVFLDSNRSFLIKTWRKKFVHNSCYICVTDPNRISSKNGAHF